MIKQDPDLCIKEALDIIIAGFKPDRIILFGSFAYGVPKFDSDIDLLVIMDTTLSPVERSVPIRKALRDIAFPFDILVKTPEEFTRYQDVVGTVAHTASVKGKTLYEHP
ncbi:MAG: nucleotidyltransferase domain-containing protein [Nitrospirae bacterium]|nr:nucleotidyltransferase domain-containing protein [Nitrospirota bacterium]